MQSNYSVLVPAEKAGRYPVAFLIIFAFTFIQFAKSIFFNFLPATQIILTPHKTQTKTNNFQLNLTDVC